MSPSVFTCNVWDYFNASLASFETRIDFELFKSYILHNELSVSNALIGLVRQQHGSYAWKDSSPVTFLNWADDEPADAKGRIVQQCVKMQLNGNYSWYSVSCWQSTHYLCSVPVIKVYQNPTEDEKSEMLPSSILSDEKITKGKEKVTEFPTVDDKGSTADNSVLSVSSSQSMSMINTFAEISLILIIAISIGGIQLWRRKRRIRLSNQRIIQFDQLQNEEENAM
uniref:C-type lectin domain-containing protein n=1 Tax=Setaria digitata TaxID=48799 RepID=A0A915PXI2_9BILA